MKRLLYLLFLLFPFVSVFSQTTYFSNLGNWPSNYLSVGGDVYEAGGELGGVLVAAPFRTGNTGAYLLKSVTLQMDNAEGSPGTPFEVYIYNNDLGVDNPWRELVLMDGDPHPVGSGEYTYTESHGNIILNPSTVYWVVASFSGDAADFYKWNTTSDASISASASWERPVNGYAVKYTSESSWNFYDANGGFYALGYPMLSIEASQIPPDVTDIGAVINSDKSITFSWTAASGSPEGYIVLCREGGSVQTTYPTKGYTSLPAGNADFTLASSGSSIGAADGDKLVYIGTGTTVKVTNLTKDNNYYFKVFSFKSGAWSFGVSTSGFQALPVELSALSAKASEGAIELNWATATEVNNYGFEIERKIKDWEKIGFVQGSGNSNSPRQYSFVDKTAPAGNLQYRLKQVDNDGKYKYYDAVSVKMDSPKEYKLLQNSPNPFNPVTAIKFQLPVSSFVTIKIYDHLGREITTLLNEEKPSGSHIVFWNGKDSQGQNVSSGVYLYRISAGNYVETRKMNLLK